MNNALAGRVAIITGANQGLGSEIARFYADAGASLLICARDAVLLEKTAQEIRARMTPSQRLVVQPADVSSAADCAQLSARAIDELSRIDILVNNAGVYGPKGAIDDVDWNDWVRAIEINLLGSVLMCRSVIPHFKRQRYGKVVQLSGGGATNPLPGISAYAASKAAIVRFIETLAGEVQGDGIDANSIAPGPLNTRMLDEVLAAGPEKVGDAFFQRALEQKESGGAPLAAAARLAVFLGSAASDGITGKLISALWDPWGEFPSHMADLSTSDVYTLRRIVPGDRGLNWGSAK